MQPELDALIATRSRTHGDFKETGTVAQRIKQAMRGTGWNALPPYQCEVLDMMAQKMARILTGDPLVPDHWRDLAGYPYMVLKTLEEADQVRDGASREVILQRLRKGISEHREGGK